MNILADVIISILASIGVVCILKEVYDIIIVNCETSENDIVMTISGDGKQSEICLRKALNIRQRYFHKMKIVFLDRNISESTPAKRMAHKYQMIYVNGKEQQCREQNMK